MDCTVVVVTHNRAGLLRETIRSIAKLTYARQWELLVVDNNSSDDTPSVVAQERAAFPVALRYLFVGQPGKYHALNAAIAEAHGSKVAATDDDAYPEKDWLTRADEGLERYGCAFVGGPVYPVWRRSPPSWIDPDSAICGKVLGLQNHGGSPREYGVGGISWPLGVNVVYRREAFERAGLFDGRLGRVAGTLRNQSQREWHLRARAAGLRGMYVPDIVVHHSVDPERVTQQYFRRWFYWHGVSRAILSQNSGRHLLDPEGTATHTGERHLLGVPACVWCEAARATLSAGRRRLTGRRAEAVEYELMMCFYAGVVRQLRRGSPRPVVTSSPPVRVAHTHR